MRIAILADPLDTQSAGIHVYTREMLRAMVGLGAPHEFVVVRAQKGTVQHPQVEEVVVPIRTFLPFHLRWRQLFVIPRILRKKKVDVVIEPAHFGPFNLSPTVRRVTVIHDLTPVLFPALHDKMSHYLHKWLLPRILRKADLVITNSEFTRQDVVRYYPFTAQKSKAILLGKDTLYRPVKDGTVLEKYGIGVHYFLFVGTLEPRKNLDILLAAFEAFKTKDNQGYQLVLVGKKGWKMDAFFEKVTQSPCQKDIVLTGYVPITDLPVLYSMSRCTVYPSHYEGFGLPVLEAMACGAPVICTQYSSLPEVGGDAAHYFDGTSYQALTHLLHRFATDSNIYQVAQQKSLHQAALFSWEKAAQELIACLEKIV